MRRACEAWRERDLDPAASRSRIREARNSVRAYARYQPQRQAENLPFIRRGRDRRQTRAGRGRCRELRRAGIDARLRESCRGEGFPWKSVRARVREVRHPVRAHALAVGDGVARRVAAALRRGRRGGRGAAPTTGRGQEGNPGEGGRDRDGAPQAARPSARARRQARVPGCVLLIIGFRAHASVVARRLLHRRNAVTVLQQHFRHLGDRVAGQAPGQG